MRFPDVIKNAAQADIVWGKIKQGTTIQPEMIELLMQLPNAPLHAVKLAAEYPYQARDHLSRMESVIATDAEASYLYAVLGLKCKQFPAGESAIRKSRKFTVLYEYEVILCGGRITIPRIYRLVRWWIQLWSK